MANFKNIWRLAGLLCLVMCLCVCFAACGGGDDTTESTQAPTVGDSTYTIQVSTVSGIQLKDLSVYVYTDATMGELETMKPLDENGTATFTATTADYVAVLMGVPEGYNVQQYYTFDSKNQANIVLSSSVITGAEKPADKTYALGDIMYDFSVTASDGVVYTLSELLQQKEAVVLNFWYLNCGPCKIEFPYLEMAYAEYSDRIELLAINCEDGNDAELNAFKAENDLTFPMAIGDKNYWYPAAYYACPTTIVVDRYGMIVYMHTGYYDEVAPFNAMFRVVTGEDYQPVLIQEIESLITEDDYRPDGSMERPFEMGGATEFDVKVPANGKIYYNLYRLDNITMRIENPDAYVIVDGVTYYPTDGVIELKVSCPDTFSPLSVVFGNRSSDRNTIHVQYMFEPGNVNNPIGLVLGENEVAVKDVNGLGTYYTYTATADGILQLTVLNCTDLATADIHLYNQNTFESKYLSYDGVTDENGQTVVSVAVFVGDVIQIIFSASTEPDITLSGANILALASILEGEGSGIIDGRIGYSVTVVDQDGNPVSGVQLSVSANGQNSILTTDEFGSAGIRLMENAYLLEMLIPPGYAADTSSFLWSPGKTHLDIQLAITGQLRVQILKEDGVAVAGVLVQIYGDPELKRLVYTLTTDADGLLTFVGRTDIPYYLVLQGVESDLLVEEIYATTEDFTKILLKYNQPPLLNLSDLVPEFVVEDINGQTHSLQAMLKEKDVVVLAFWERTSGAATVNMINLQKMYEQFGDRVAILGLNPVDQTDMELTIFQKLYGITFPMARCEDRLVESLQISSYPATVIIDREGRICFVRSGYISQDDCTAIFTFLLAEDYVHTPIEGGGVMPTDGQPATVFKRRIRTRERVR